MNKPKGFTLIELLLVISIIGLLSSVVFASLNDARAKGRDATRIQQALQVRSAIEMYYANTGEYPSMLDPWGGNIDEDPSAGYQCTDDTAPGYDWTCYWSESQETFFLWQLWDTANGGGGYLGGKPIDPFFGGAGQWDYQYQYQKYSAGSNGCDISKGDYYVFAINNLETVPNGSGNHHASSPGFSCGSTDWHTGLEWVTGNFE